MVLSTLKDWRRVAIWLVVAWRTKRMEILQIIRWEVLGEICGKLDRRGVLAITLCTLAWGTLIHWAGENSVEMIHFCWNEWWAMLLCACSPTWAFVGEEIEANGSQYRATATSAGQRLPEKSNGYLGRGTGAKQNNSWGQQLNWNVYFICMNGGCEKVLYFMSYGHTLSLRFIFGGWCLWLGCTMVKVHNCNIIKCLRLPFFLHCGCP